MSSPATCARSAGPRIRTAPPAVESFGQAAAALSSGYGLRPDPWQQLVLDDILGTTDAGKWAASQWAISCPRQNGKNGIIEIRELFGMVGLGERILHTAHEVKTARKAYLRLLGFFDNQRKYPELFDLVEEVRKTNGQEMILLKNGGSVEFIARSKASGRGFTADVLVMDEAQDLTDDQLAALLPTISSAPLGSPQQIVAGTPPDGTGGEVFGRMRHAGIEKTNPRLAYHEWSAEDDVDLDDQQAWRASNPSLGIRLQLSVVEDERAAMDDDTFARERLGIWNAGASNAPIDPQSWAAVADTDSQIVGPVSVAIDVAPDNRTGSVAVAGRRADGRVHVELVDNRAGAGWIVDFVKAMQRKNALRVVRVQGGNAPSAPLIEPLTDAGLPVKVTGPNDAGTACASLYSSVMDRSLRHLDQPVVNSALADARKRALGTEGLWVWNRKNTTVDITPVIALTLAAAAVDAAPPTPKHSVSHAMYGFN